MSNNVLVPLDGSPLADAAVPHAVELARRTGAALRVVRVHAPMTPMAVQGAPVMLPDPEIEAQIVATRQAWLDARSKEIRSSSGLVVHPEFRVGIPGEEIVAAATESDSAFIVCTTHGSGGWAPHWFGSVTDFVIRHSPVPVLAMSSAAAARATKLSRMLVLLDGSERSAAILPEVKTVAKAFGARIELLRIVSAPWTGDPEFVPPERIDRFDIDAYAAEAKQGLDAVAEDLSAGGLSVTAIVEVGNRPTHSIIEYIQSSNPDLVALATHGRGVARLLLGSVADKVLRAGGRPMLCVRPRHVGAAESIRKLEASLAAGAPALVS